MKPEQFHANQNVVFLHAWPTGRHRTGERRDASLADLRDLWPNVIDLAKQPGVMGRLQAMLGD